MSHTPGPWLAEPEYEGEPVCYVHIDGRGIADCHMGYQNEDEANARLIAAAPELLELARQVACEFDDAKYPHSVEGRLRDAAKAAIAKATGAVRETV